MILAPHRPWALPGVVFATSLALSACPRPAPCGGTAATSPPLASAEPPGTPPDPEPAPSAAPPPTEPAAWQGLAPDATGAIDVAPFNAVLATCPPWPATAAELALVAVGPREGTPRISLDVVHLHEGRRSNESGSVARASVTIDGLLDDSVRALRYELELTRSPRPACPIAWELAAATATWQCHAGRGHQDFSTRPCE